MDESNQQSADGQNNILDVNRLISAQNLKFDHLTEVLRNTLNAFRQDLGRHLGELINNKPNNSDRDSTTEPPAKRQKVQASTYQYDADQSTGPHDPEHDGPLPASQGRPEDRQGIGLIPQRLMSLKTQMGIGHLRQDGGKGQQLQRAKTPRAKDMSDLHLQAQSLLIGNLKHIIMHMMIQIVLAFMLAMKNLHLNRRLMICIP